MSTRNKWYSALQRGHSCSKKGHSERVETKWTATFGWWWSLEKSSPLQSLQPKNPIDLHNLQNPFTCEMLLNLPHVLIFHLDLLLLSVKYLLCIYFPVLWWKDRLWLLHVITKKFLKILVLCSIFLLWWKTVYFQSLIMLSFTQHFFS